ncbi:16204_t:CDS:2, partial [Racocetra persica]
IKSTIDLKAEKKPATAGKAPATKAFSEKKDSKKSIAPGKKSKKCKVRKETYSHYIYKVLKQSQISYELAKHVVSEGTKAITKYTSFK